MLKYIFTTVRKVGKNLFAEYEVFATFFANSMACCGSATDKCVLDLSTGTGRWITHYRTESTAG